MISKFREGEIEVKTDRMGRMVEEKRGGIGEEKMKDKGRIDNSKMRKNGNKKKKRKGKEKRKSNKENCNIITTLRRSFI